MIIALRNIVLSSSLLLLELLRGVVLVIVVMIVLVIVIVMVWCSGRVRFLASSDERTRLNHWLVRLLFVIILQYQHLFL